jgi:sarcosine oxidase subunit alpha
MPAVASPFALTPLHHWHAAHGALFVANNGWQTVTRYADLAAEEAAIRTGLGLADVSASAKLALQGPGVAIVAQALVADRAADRPHAVGSLSSGGKTLACRLTDDHLLLLAMGPEVADLSAALADLCREQPLLSSDMTSALAGFLLVGPHVEVFLRRVTHLDVRPTAFPVNSCVETSLAGVEALLVKLGEPTSSIRIYVAWDMAVFVWERLLEAGHDWHITPIGTEVLRTLGANTK